MSDSHDSGSAGAQGPDRGGWRPGNRGRPGGARRATEARGGSRRNARGHERNRRTQRERTFSAHAPGQRRRHADPARLTAYRALREVSDQDAYGNLVLPRLVRDARLDRRDAAFASELAYGAMRRRGTWDAVLARCVDRPLDRLDPAVLDVLRLGVHQLLAMRVPDHAALDATVGLTREQIGAGPAGLVNAVLRRVAARDLDEWLDVLEADTPDELGRLAVRYAHPAWQVRALRRALRASGRDPEELSQLLAADNAAPEVQLVALPGLGDLRPVLDAGARSGTLVADSAISPGGDIHRIPGTREGTVRVQDAGSQLVARVLAALPVDHDRGRWADACAGPGGKAALLAALAAQRGATVLANEISDHRARLVSSALRPVPHDVWTVRTGDGRELAREAGEGFDRILVDAPCTGLGALRRRPEARWRRRPSDVADLAPVQRDLLRAALDAARPGGVVLYATCSPHTAETVDVVADVLEQYSHVRVLDTAAAAREVALPGAFATGHDAAWPWPGGGSAVQLWPHVHGTDAMFMIGLRVGPRDTEPHRGDTSRDAGLGANLEPSHTAVQDRPESTSGGQP